jgi:hypothetical protein
MMGMRLRAILAAALLLVGCSARTPAGHIGPRVKGAVDVHIEPLQQHVLRFYTGGGSRHGNPFIEVHESLRNVSAFPVVVRNCSADAFDVSGAHLFTWRPHGFGGLLRPGDHIGGPNTTAGVAAPDGISARDLSHVATYAVECDAWRWVGPLLSPEND